MDLKLRVYSGKEVAKEYSTDEFFITVGVCEDVFRLIDVDALILAADGHNAEAEKTVTRNIVHAFVDFYPIAKQLYPEITEDEFKHCLPNDVATVMWAVMRYAFEQLKGVDAEKNRA